MLVHSGWRPARALLYNVISALGFLAGGVVAWAAARGMDVTFLVPFAAGNFVYIAASDLVPEVNRHPDWRTALIHLAAFATGMGLLAGLRLLP